MLSLAPIVVEILMARGSGHKITSSVRYRSGETESGTTRVVRKNVLLLKKETLMARMRSFEYTFIDRASFP
jgi:hypothetical protein